MLELLPSPFAPRLRQFLETLEHNCFICSPYVTLGPVQQLIEIIRQKKTEESIEIKMLTDISPQNLVQKSTDIDALILLMKNVKNVEITYLPRVHAKVYIAGECEAIVSSANFTQGGTVVNLEYGISIKEPKIVREISDDITRYSRLGSAVSAEQLDDLKERVEQLREAIGEEQRSIRAKTRALSAQLRRETENNLIRVRTSQRTTHAIFAETLLYLLSRRALPTVDLHEMIREIHPDLCNDSVERVIDGKKFGKFWKHEVRSAQASLKRKGAIKYDADSRLWTLAE